MLQPSQWPDTISLFHYLSSQGSALPLGQTPSVSFTINHMVQPSHWTDTISLLHYSTSHGSALQLTRHHQSPSETQVNTLKNPRPPPLPQGAHKSLIHFSSNNTYKWTLWKIPPLPQATSPQSFIFLPITHASEHSENPCSMQNATNLNENWSLIIKDPYTNAEKKHGQYCLKAPRGLKNWPTDKSWVSFEKFRKFSSRWALRFLNFDQRKLRNLHLKILTFILKSLIYDPNAPNRVSNK